MIEREKMIEITYTDLVNDTVKKSLLDFKYNGKDDSILYQKVISPLCQKIVDDHLPEYLAPNTITVFGFIVNIIPHLLIVITDTHDLTTPYPFLLFLQGLAIIIYSVLLFLTRSVIIVMENKHAKLELHPLLA